MAGQVHLLDSHSYSTSVGMGGDKMICKYKAMLGEADKECENADNPKECVSGVCPYYEKWWDLYIEGRINDSQRISDTV